MKRDYFFAGIIAVAAGATAMAQAQPGQATAPGQSSKPATTIMGCLMPGTSTPGSGGGSGTGVEGANADAANSAAFILMTINNAPSASQSASASPQSYQLIGGNPADMQRLTRQRVEIQGTLEPATTPGATPTTPATPPSSIPTATPPSSATPASPTSPASPTPTSPAAPSSPTTPNPTPPPTPPTGTVGTAGSGSPTSIGMNGATPGTLAAGTVSSSSRFHVTSIRPMPGNCGGN